MKPGPLPHRPPSLTLLPCPNSFPGPGYHHPHFFPIQSLLHHAPAQTDNTTPPTKDDGHRLPCKPILPGTNRQPPAPLHWERRHTLGICTQLSRCSFSKQGVEASVESHKGLGIVTQILCKPLPSARPEPLTLGEGTAKRQPQKLAL